LVVTSQQTGGQWGSLSSSVVEAFAWAASAAGTNPVNSAHLLYGLTRAHGASSEVRQLMHYFGQTEARVFAALPDLDNVPPQGLYGTTDKEFRELLNDKKEWSQLHQHVTEAIEGSQMTSNLDHYREVLPVISRYTFKDWEEP
jgi:hypothetical protein